MRGAIRRNGASEARESIDVDVARFDVEPNVGPGAFGVRRAREDAASHVAQRRSRLEALEPHAGAFGVARVARGAQPEIDSRALEFARYLRQQPRRETSERREIDRASLRFELEIAPFEVERHARQRQPTGRNSPVAQTASAVLRDMGLNAALAGVPYGSDASKLLRHGVPSIIFGPGSIDQAHAAVEYVECRQVLQAEEFYREFLMRFR